MLESHLTNGQHFELLTDIPILAMSDTMRDLGLSLGNSTTEHGLIGFGDPMPTKIHSELIYHKNLVPYFMLGCVQAAIEGGSTVIYDAVKAAQIVSDEEPALLGVTMVYHAEHYEDTKAVVPLIRKKRGEEFLAFRQKKFELNEVRNLPEHWNEEDFYTYVDTVMSRSKEFDRVLAPGEVILVDNYKTLHERTAYDGIRKIIRVRVDDPDSNKKYLMNPEGI